MKIAHRYYLSIIIVNVLLLSSSQVSGETEMGYALQQDYSTQVEKKAENGFVNIVSAPLEIPKSIINTTNQSNVFFGFVGGTLKGVINTVGRVVVGVSDLITAPLLTKPVVEPMRVWDDFDEDTRYDDVFRLQEE